MKRIIPNQSVNGLVNRMLFNGNNLEWDAWHFAPPNAIVQLATMLTSALLIGAGYVLHKKIAGKLIPGWVS